MRKQKLVSAGYDIREDADQPGLWLWTKVHEGSDISFSSEDEAWEDAARHLQSSDEGCIEDGGVGQGGRTKLESYVEQNGAQIVVRDKKLTFEGATTAGNISVATLRGPRSVFSAVLCPYVRIAGKPDAEVWSVIGSAGRIVVEFAVSEGRLFAIS